MTPSRLSWLALLVLSTLVTTYAAARRLPALRGVAVACGVFVGLDAGRFLYSLAVEAHALALLTSPDPVAPLPAWWAWADVAAFALMPGVWAGLLAGNIQREGSAVSHEDGSPSGGARPKRRGNIQRNILALAPLALCLLYASALLWARHHPTVRASWGTLLAVPRLVVGSAALLAALARPRGPLQWLHGVNWKGEPESLPYRPRLPLAPPRLVGVVMGLGCAACVVGGLWADWRGVQAVSAVAWVLTAAVVWRAR